MFLPVRFCSGFRASVCFEQTKMWTGKMCVCVCDFACQQICLATAADLHAFSISAKSQSNIGSGFCALTILCLANPDQTNFECEQACFETINRGNASFYAPVLQSHALLHILIDPTESYFPGNVGLALCIKTQHHTRSVQCKMTKSVRIPTLWRKIRCKSTLDRHHPFNVILLPNLHGYACNRNGKTTF